MPDPPVDDVALAFLAGERVWSLLADLTHGERSMWTVGVSIIAGLLTGVVAALLSWRFFSKSIGIEWPIDLLVPALMLVAAGSVLTALLIAVVVAAAPMSRRRDALG